MGSQRDGEVKNCIRAFEQRLLGAIMALTEKGNSRDAEDWEGWLNGEADEFILWTCYIFTCLDIFW